MDKHTLARLEQLCKAYEALPYFTTYANKKELDGLDIYVQSVGRHAQEYAKLPLWKVILIDLVTRIDIWQKDKDGNIEYNDGYPKISIVKLMFNLGKVISYLLVLIGESKALQKS